jgi:hypothetical protein
MNALRSWLAPVLRGGPTDSAWGYGVSLATVWAPLVLVVQMERRGLRHDSYFGLTAVVTSIIGMLIGGGIVYHVTRASRGLGRPRPRAIILGVTVPFVSVSIAAVPCVVFGPIAALAMLFYGITFLHWGIVLTTIWSAIYLALPASDRIPIYARQAPADDPARNAYFVGFFIISVALFALYINSFAFVGTWP